LKLNDLQNEILVWIKLRRFCGLNDDCFKVHISFTRDLDFREQITEQSIEDIQIGEGNLWQIEISQCSHKQGELGNIGFITLKHTCYHEHTLNSSQTPIVMELF
jgi:hypothetical protein